MKKAILFETCSFSNLFVELKIILPVLQSIQFKTVLIDKNRTVGFRNENRKKARNRRNKLSLNLILFFGLLPHKTNRSVIGGYQFKNFIGRKPWLLFVGYIQYRRITFGCYFINQRSK